MQLADSLLGKAILFTVMAYALPVLLGWWLIGTRIKGALEPVAQPSPRQAGGLAALLGLSGLQLTLGGLWDASMHIQTGKIAAGEDFLWAPHIMIYAAFAISLGIAGFALGSLARQGWRSGIRDPRRWIRANPYLGAVGLASLYSILSIPGDAVWHEIFGVDLTAWSPPHVMLGLTGCAVVISAVGLLARTRERSPFWSDLGAVGLLAVAVNMAMLVGVLEWELPTTRNPFVEARPIWLYPVVSATVSFVSLVLAKAVVRSRWAATAQAGINLAFRAAVMVVFGLTDNVVPLFPLVAVLGGLVLDLLPWERIGSPLPRGLAMAAGYTLGFALLSLPILQARPDLPVFTASDIAMMLAVTTAVCAGLHPMASAIGRKLRGEPQLGQPRRLYA